MGRENLTLFETLGNNRLAACVKSTFTPTPTELTCGSDLSF
jgi:hypothetical protein